MATNSETQLYNIFHLIRFILNVIIFIATLLFLFGGCFRNQLRSSKRQWLIFNLCIAMIIFAIINSVFVMLPLAPTYKTVLAGQTCTLRHFLEDVAQGQVAYSLLAFCIHQIGPQEWRNGSNLWFGICISIQWICSYLLPLPQILMSNVFICLAFYPIPFYLTYSLVFYPNQFYPIYSLVFLLALPVFLHLIIYIIINIFKKNETTNNQVHPIEHIVPIEIVYQSLMKYILIMALLFDIIGYGPKGILATIDIRLKQSIALYSALEILPSLCLLINIGLLYKMNKEILKNILSICRC